MIVSIRSANDSDRTWMLQVVRGWGADFVVTRGRKVFAAKLPAFIAESVGRNQPASGGFDSAHEPCQADAYICRDSAANRGGFEADPPYDNTIGRKKLGLVTYEIIGDQCEVVTLDAFKQFSGIGTALMQRVVETARAAGCRRVWLITTNDNLDAIRFYQKRGFTIAAVHVNAIAQSRDLKPSIPLIGNYGIPIRDEVEFEMLLE